LRPFLARKRRLIRFSVRDSTDFYLADVAAQSQKSQKNVQMDEHKKRDLDQLGTITRPSADRRHHAHEMARKKRQWKWPFLCSSIWTVFCDFCRSATLPQIDFAVEFCINLAQ
jgi:hypothetical protein